MGTLTRIPFAFTMLHSAARMNTRSQTRIISLLVNYSKKIVLYAESGNMFLKFAGFFRPDHDPPLAR
jgi:hypothetical protein